MHKLADYIQKQINIPLVHIADCVAQKCKDNNVKKVGLLGTRYTMIEDFLKNRLNKNGLEVSVPNSEEEVLQKDISIPIFDTTQSHIDSIVNLCLGN